MLGSAAAAAATGGGGKQVTERFSLTVHSTPQAERPTHHRLGFSGYRA